MGAVRHKLSRHKPAFRSWVTCSTSQCFTPPKLRRVPYKTRHATHPKYSAISERGRLTISIQAVQNKGQRLRGRTTWPPSQRSDGCGSDRSQIRSCVGCRTFTRGDRRAFSSTVQRQKCRGFCRLVSPRYQRLLRSCSCSSTSTHPIARKCAETARLLKLYRFLIHGSLRDRQIVNHTDVCVAVLCECSSEDATSAP